MKPSLFHRRQVLKGGLAAGLTAGLAAVLPVPPARAATPPTLRPAPRSVALLGAGEPPTDVWAYGDVPGPVLRLKRGAEATIRVENALPEPTTVHWHGLRIANAMDGVPELTQAPIPPGGAFTYRFTPPDAGTFWYHPHVRSAVQVGRGLYGALVVDEDAPPPVDRDQVWVLDDWRLTDEAAIAEPFGHMMDLTHAGRLGNVPTLNGRLVETVPARAGERWRLRLVNVANARIMALRFTGHAPTVIALDGHPVAPHAPAEGRILLGPGMRADVILDLTGEPGSAHAVVDDFYPRQAYRVVDLAYGPEPAVRQDAAPLPTLAANSLAEPDLAKARPLDLTITGGAMGTLRQAVLKGESLDIRALVQKGKAWALNGVVADGMKMPPLFTLDRGQSYVMRLVNDTGWPHPMHLHGHAFRILRQGGKDVPHRPWADTVLLAARGTADIALVADNPGDWLFHCHILEHHQAGMACVVRVA
ncbi:MAG: multicopper oxidase family protein [Rhodobacterales bacterium]|nr:multicopper oxidase family protein [Rhodobacterales bacterium]